MTWILVGRPVIHKSIKFAWKVFWEFLVNTGWFLKKCLRYSKDFRKRQMFAGNV